MLVSKCAKFGPNSVMLPCINRVTDFPIKVRPQVFVPLRPHVEKLTLDTRPGLRPHSPGDMLTPKAPNPILVPVVLNVLHTHK